MGFRITQNMMNQTLLTNLQTNYQAMDKTQQQLSTGKILTKPSDNPVSAVRAMYYKNTLSEIDQYKSNVSDGTSWMQSTDSALDEVTQVLQRVRELTVQASNDTNTASDRQAISSELSQLKDHLGEVANTEFGGNYIFAGADTKTPVYDASKTPAFNNSPGMNQDIKYEVGKGTSVAINVKGTDVFGQNGEMFNLIDNIVTDLKNGTNPTDQLSAIDAQIDNVSMNRSDLGARMNRFDMSSSRLDTLEQSTTSLLSNETDVDIPKAMVDFTNQQNVYKSALSAGAKIIQPSLVDFLR